MSRTWYSLYDIEFIILIITASLQACSKNKKVQYEFENKKVDPYQLYEEGFYAFEKD